MAEIRPVGTKDSDRGGLMSARGTNIESLHKFAKDLSEGMRGREGGECFTVIRGGDVSLPLLLLLFLLQLSYNFV
jgi:hypothetical protein